jgi:hypothetical protein
MYLQFNSGIKKGPRRRERPGARPKFPAWNFGLEDAGGGEDERGLPRPEEAADHRDAWFDKEKRDRPGGLSYRGLHKRRSSPSFSVAFGV